MIRKTYHSNVNCADPKFYFENFYKHCWYEIGNLGNLDRNHRIVDIIRDELKKCDVTIIWHYNSNLFTVTYPNDEDYTAFKLRWV